MSAHGSILDREERDEVLKRTKLVARRAIDGRTYECRQYDDGFEVVLDDRRSEGAYLYRNFTSFESFFREIEADEDGPTDEGWQ